MTKTQPAYKADEPNWPHGYLMAAGSSGGTLPAVFMAGDIKDELRPLAWRILSLSGEFIAQSTISGEMGGPSRIVCAPDPDADDGSALWLARNMHKQWDLFSSKSAAHRELAAIIGRMEAEL